MVASTEIPKLAIGAQAEVCPRRESWVRQCPEEWSHSKDPRK